MRPIIFVNFPEGFENREDVLRQICRYKISQLKVPCWTKAVILPWSDKRFMKIDNTANGYSVSSLLTS